MIIDELMQGTRTFTVNNDGSETFTDKPPNRKELRAVAAIKQLIDVNQGLQRANNTLLNNLSDAQAAHAQLVTKLAEFEKRCLDLQGLINKATPETPIEINQENFGIADDGIIDYN